MMSGNGGSECSSPEVSPKRIKMESGSSTSGNPDGQKLPPQPRLIWTSTQNFEVIKTMPGFVDHTHFIQRFLSEEQPTLAIFAPRRFGKSSHLDMLKTFLSCVKAHKPYANINCPPKERENYKLFEGTNIINCNDILEKHLGKHPVIHLDLKGAGSILGVEDAKTHFREVVQKAYQEHLYLKTSQKLCANDPEANAKAQQNCKEWCDDRECMNQRLNNCLRNLARYLYNHFDGAKVYVLVDEFDAINASALRKVKGNVKDKINQVEDIANVVTLSLSAITKGAHEYVGGALITGVSYIAGIGCSPDLNNFKHIRFLEGDSIVSSDKDFVPFYGATEMEVESLIKKLVQKNQLVKFKENEEFLDGELNLDADKIMCDVKSRYNGYIDKKGRPIFCLWSVLQYLETGEPNHFWSQTDGVQMELHNLFRSGAISVDVLNLMQGKTITFKRLDKIHIWNVLELQELIDEETKESTSEIVLNFLMDQGYLSYTECKDEIKIPNSEIQATFSQIMWSVIKDEWKLIPDIESCAQEINKLSSDYTEKETLQKRMLVIHKKLTNSLETLQLKKPSHINEAMIMCMLYGTMDKACLFELTVDLHLKKEGIIVSSGRPDFFLKHKSDEFCILWELKFNKKERDGEKTENMTSKYALEEARGNALTTKGTKKDYMDAIIGKLKLKALVIGLSVDGNFNVSLSYALDKEPEIFCITEKENELHPEYYSNCIMLFNKDAGDTQ